MKFLSAYAVASFTRRVGWMLRSIRIHPFRWLPQTAWRLSPFSCPLRCSDAFMHMHTRATPVSVILVRFSLRNGISARRNSHIFSSSWDNESLKIFSCGCKTALAITVTAFLNRPAVCIYRARTTEPFSLIHRRERIVRNVLWNLHCKDEYL